MTETKDNIVEQDMQICCFNCCPKCGATDPNIAWGDKDWKATQAWQDARQNATCLKCGCDFEEVYTYTHTEYREKRVKCSHPMSLFYNYEDEIPENTRVSTPKDCEECEGMPGCDEVGFCLIDGDGEVEVYNPYALYYEGQSKEEQQKAIKISSKITDIIAKLAKTDCNKKDLKEAGLKIKAFEDEGVGVGDTATDESITAEFGKRLREKGKSDEQADVLADYFYDVLHYS